MKFSIIIVIFLLASVAAVRFFLPEASNEEGSELALELSEAQAELAQSRKNEKTLQKALKAKQDENTALIQQLSKLKLEQRRPPSETDDFSGSVIEEETETNVAGDEAYRPRDRRLITRDDLVNAGFVTIEVDRILELEAAALEKIDDALADPETSGREAIRKVRIEQATVLRTELGDYGYEQYREARKLPTSVPVISIDELSAGASAGLKKGDEIISYAGQRVFDISDLQTAVTEGFDGETVVVEVRRGDHQLALTLPRGRIGIASNSRPGGLR